MSRKRKRRINPVFLWTLLLAACGLFLFEFAQMPMFPLRWTFLTAGVILLVLAVLFLLSCKASIRNSFIRILNGTLTIAVLIASVLMPLYTDKISELFSSLTGNKTKISVYVLTSEYKNAHNDIFWNSMGTYEDLQSYAEGRFITMVSTDTENQIYAADEIRKTLNKQFHVIDRASVQEAAASLYNNEGDVLVMSEAMESLVTDTEGCENFRSDTIKIATFVRTITGGTEPSRSKVTKEPFSIFFGGNDETGELSLVGRTDVDMVVTVNPNTHQISIVSMPRDSFVPNPAYDGAKDKLTHLGLRTIDNTLNGLGSYLDEPIENYVLINFTTYEKIIDALGGVDVDNPYAFHFWDNYDMYFEQGMIHLDGDRALHYVRERKTLPDGDFGRNMHQQLVMKAIISKITSKEVITHFNDLLSALQGTFLTNLSSESIYALCRKQLDENISWNVVNYRVEGEGGMEYCASAPTTALSVVYPYPNQVEFVRQVINDVVSGNIVEQQEMPQGSFYTEENGYNGY